MKAAILHELPGRLRIRAARPRLSFAEADMLEAWLSGLEDVTKAKVYERTADAVICYRPGPEARARVLAAVAAFGFDRVSVAVPEHSGRALQHEYVDRLALKILRRVGKKLFVPAALRPGLCVCRSFSFLRRGAGALLRGKLAVEVLDAASILVSMLRGDFSTAGQVMFLLGVGELMEEWTHRKSVADLAGAMSLHVDRVWLRTPEGQERLVGIDTVRPGDVVLVRSGGVVPLDGEVCGGEAMVNQATLTGEPLSVRKAAGSYLYAGSVVEEGELALSVRKTSGSGRYDRIVAMIEESEKLKSAAEDRASHLADRLVPWTFAAALGTWVLTRDMTRATSILNVDFCCALKLSMPIAVLSAMREAGNHAISVKGGKFLEACAEADTVVFDKTGTLTAANPSVYAVIPFSGRDEAEMLRLAACLEEHYPHSVANAVVRAARERGLDHEEKHSRVAYVVAHGIVSSVEGERVCIGSRHFIFEDEACRVPAGEEEKLARLPAEYSHLFLAVGGELAAVLLIEDPVRPDAAEAVAALHALGLKKLVMMTGDSARTAAAVAARVGLDGFRAEVLPEDKADYIRAARRDGAKVIMIGDGINDSPALSEADAGIAVSSGAAIAREIADITVSEDDLMALVTLRRLSTALMARIRANYRSILLFNSALIALGLVGVLPPASSALLHNASTIAISVRSMTDLLPE